MLEKSIELNNSISLPAEMWDLIIEKLTFIDIEKLSELRPISRYLNEIILGNKSAIFCMIYKNFRGYSPVHSMWTIDKALSITYIKSPFSSKIYHGIEIIKWMYERGLLTSKDIRKNNFHSLDIICSNRPSDYISEDLLIEDPNIAKIEIMEWLVNTFNLTVGNTRSYSTRLVRISCDAGYFKLMKWIIKTFDVGRHSMYNDIRKDENYIFRRVCAGGDLKVAKWVAKVFSLTQKDIRSCSNWAFREACSNGYENSIYYNRIHYKHLYSNINSTLGSSGPAKLDLPTKSAEDPAELGLAKWLVKEFNLTRRDAKSCNNRAFIYACGSKYNGSSIIPGFLSSFEVAKWIAETFQLTSKTIKKQNIKALTEACKSNNFEIVKWLVKKFNLTGEDIENNNCFCLSYACFYDKDYTSGESPRESQLKIARWLVKRFKSSFSSGKVNHAVQLSCGSGRLEAVKWLVRKFNLTDKDIRSEDNEALMRACLLGKLEVVKWLVEEFNLTIEDLKSRNDRIMNDIYPFTYRKGQTRDRLEVAAWLEGKFNLEKKSIYKKNKFENHRFMCM